MTPRLRRTLLALAIIPVAFALAAGWHLLQQPRARRVGNVAIDRSPERVARGEYLARHVAACFQCHSEVDSSRIGRPPIPGRAGAGRVFESAAKDGRVVAGNLTSDATGLASWSDDEILRAIREGVGRRRNALHPAMPYAAYRSMSDEDAHAIVAYLRSLPPIANELPATKLHVTVRLDIAGLPTPLDSAVPPPSDDVQGRGHYLATLARCLDCHRDDLPRVTRASRAAFVGRFRSLARHPPGEEPRMNPALTSEMPWSALSGMTEADLGAIHEYLATQGSGPAP